MFVAAASRWLVAVAAVSIATARPAHGNGRPPMTNGIHFHPHDAQSLYVATTFGLLVSPDGCAFHWLCEDDIGFAGEFDPAYAVTPSGAILATTFHGLRVSRDGGCSFTTAALPGGDPTAVYLDAVEVGPGGEVCVGSSDTAADNAVLCSTDDAVTFAPRGALPATMWYRSIKFAPGDASRIYVTGYQIAGSDADGGQRSPTAHLFRSDDDGLHWTEEPLAGLMYGSVPRIDVMAVSPANEDVVFLRSQGANPPVGDRLYRSVDGGISFAEVLATTDPIADVVARDTATVLVATAQTGSFRSRDGGATFQPLGMALACLGQRSDGVLFGCTANYATGMALAQSADGDAWHAVLRLQYITGALHCPAGTSEHDTCDAVQWPALAVQLGVTAATCASGPDGGTDGVRADTGAPRGSGCCDAGDASGGLALTGWLLIGWCGRARRRYRAIRRPPPRRAQSSLTAAYSSPGGGANTRRSSSSSSGSAPPASHTVAATWLVAGGCHPPRSPHA